MFIAEMSRASQTLGFQFSFALANTKPSLYLYHAGAKSEPGGILRNNPSRLLKIKDYDKFSTKHSIFQSINFYHGLEVVPVERACDKVKVAQGSADVLAVPNTVFAKLLKYSQLPLYLI